MENDKTTPDVPPLLASNGQPSVPTKEELQAFIQARSYYYIPKWQSFDPTLKRIAPGTFNWAACLLNVFWMAYRRMYLFVIILVAIGYSIGGSIELIFGLRTSLTNYLGIAMMILLGRYGNSIYRKHVERKIRQIKTKISPEYWSQAFRDSGGTSLWAPIPLIILQLLTLFGMFYGIYQGILQKNLKANAVANISTVAQATDSWMNAGFPDDKSAPQTPVTAAPAPLVDDNRSFDDYFKQSLAAQAAGTSVPLPTSAPDSASEFDKDKKLAENGNVIAQYNLGVYYYNGVGVAVDYSEAVKWSRKAAEQGDAAAQSNLGVCYYTGNGVPQDYAEAVKWFQMAADQGNAIAQSILAASYANGEGVEKNFVEAYKWYNLASAQGNISATTARDNLAASMTPDQIAEAQKLSSGFQPQKESASTNSN